METINLTGRSIPRVRAGTGGSDSGGTGTGRSNSTPCQVAAASSGKRPWQNLSTRFLIRNPLEFLWPGTGSGSDGEKRCNGIAVDDVVADVESCSGCEVDFDDECENEKIEFDSNVFSRFLKRVCLTDAKMFAQLSHLSMLAYCIPKIKDNKLLQNRGLTYVTSSLDKKGTLLIEDKDGAYLQTQVGEGGENEKVDDNGPNSGRHFIDASAVYDIAASAAAYLHSQTKSMLPFRSSNGEETICGDTNGSCTDGEQEKASIKTTAETVTRIISLEKELKQSLVNDLSSTVSSPCEWYICDDDVTATRYFVIQGSESIASWQTNLLFEPVRFEGLDMLVHKGIYEAAKGIYEQMLPDIRSHMKSRGDYATLRFTGHSLGGSLAMLVNLMLHIRHEVPESCLLPVVTFGAPFIMCGGDKLLTKLGLPKSHIQALILHRDLVPRAFSSDLPSRAVDLLKAVNGNFNSHPCLNKQNVLYSPMGQLLILQSDPRFSPSHSLLPPGSGLYLLTTETDKPVTGKSLQSAQLAFLNNPHPLEILSDRAAYGADGTIMRDHDMKSYLKAIRVVIRHELNQINKAQTDQGNKDLWPLVSPRIRASVGQLTTAASIFHREEQLKLFGALHNGKQSLKRFSRLVASQHMEMFVLLLVPTKLLILEAYNALSFT